MKALLLVPAIAAMSAAATLDAQGVKGQPDSTCTKYSDGRVECRVFRRSFSGTRHSATGFFCEWILQWRSARPLVSSFARPARVAIRSAYSSRGDAERSRGERRYNRG